MNPEQVVGLQAHVEALCRRHRVAVGKRTWRARAYPDSRIINVPYVRGPVSYLVALHEVGHVVDPRAGRDGLYRHRNRMASEATAWRWALAQSLIPPTRPCLRSIHHALFGYLWIAHLDRRFARMYPALLGHLFQTLPPRTHYVWRLLDRIEGELGEPTYRRGGVAVTARSLFPDRWPSPEPPERQNPSRWPPLTGDPARYSTASIDPGEGANTPHGNRPT